MFATQIGELPWVLQSAWIGERRFDLARPRERVSEAIAETQLSFPGPYF